MALTSFFSGQQRWILIVLFASLILRGAVLLVGADRLSQDPDAYRALAQSLAQTGVYGLTDAAGQPNPTAFRPPLYPWLLSWLVIDSQLSNFAVVILHTVLGSLSVLFTFLAGRHLFRESEWPWCSLSAAALVAIDPILLQQSLLVMTETLASTIVSIVLWWWSRSCQTSPIRFAVGLGGLSVVAFLCRPTFLVWALLLMFALPWLAMKKQHVEGERRASFWRRCLPVACSLLILAISIGGWMLRNKNAVGHPFWATSHGGYTLLLGNNPSFYDHLANGKFGQVWDPSEFFVAYSLRHQGDPTSKAFWDSPPAVTARLDPTLTEYQDDQVSYRAAKATIARQPGMFVWSCVVRMGRLWTPILHQTADRSLAVVLVIGAYFGCFYVAVVMGIRRLKREAWSLRFWPVWSLAIALTIVHAIYWSNIRMRAPIIPALALIAGAGIASRRLSPVEEPV